MYPRKLVDFSAVNGDSKWRLWSDERLIGIFPYLRYYSNLAKFQFSDGFED